MSTLLVDYEEKKDWFNISCNPGCHGPYSPVIGKHADEFKLICEAVTTVPNLALFEKALYYQKNSASTNYLIPVAQKQEADTISKEIFTKYIAEYTERDPKINEDTVLDWNSRSSRPAECVLVQPSLRNHLGWHRHAKARPREDVNAYVDGDLYLPPYVCAYHEIQHVEDTPLFATHFPDGGGELKETLKTKILCDEINKQINQQWVFNEIDYNKFLVVNNKEIPLGKALNFYRKLEEKHLSLCGAILSSESLEFLNKGRI